MVVISEGQITTNLDSSTSGLSGVCTLLAFVRYILYREGLSSKGHRYTIQESSPISRSSKWLVIARMRLGKLAKLGLWINGTAR